jgi:Lrp/AsnC family transcriptional regulator, regulator of ectoine-degradation genes
MLKLDDRDLAILSVLSTEGRLPKADLARRVNLTPTPLWERLKRLEDAGIIRGYRAEIALAKIAPHVEIFVTVELAGHTPAHFQAFEAAVARFDAITAVWSLGGGIDYLLHVVARDIDAYQRLVDALLESRAGISRYFTYVVTRAVKTPGAPPFADLLEDLPRRG